MRLDFVQLLRPDQTQARQPIGSPRLRKPPSLLLLRGDDHFAANVVRDAVLAAEIHHS